MFKTGLSIQAAFKTTRDNKTYMFCLLALWAHLAFGHGAHHHEPQQTHVQPLPQKPLHADDQTAAKIVNHQEQTRQTQPDIIVSHLPVELIIKDLVSYRRIDNLNIHSVMNDGHWRLQSDQLNLLKDAQHIFWLNQRNQDDYFIKQLSQTTDLSIVSRSGRETPWYNLDRTEKMVELIAKSLAINYPELYLAHIEKYYRYWQNKFLSLDRSHAVEVVKDESHLSRDHALFEAFNIPYATPQHHQSQCMITTNQENKTADTLYVNLYHYDDQVFGQLTYLTHQGYHLLGFLEQTLSRIYDCLVKDSAATESMTKIKPM